MLNFLAVLMSCCVVFYSRVYFGLSLFAQWSSSLTVLHILSASKNKKLIYLTFCTYYHILPLKLVYGIHLLLHLILLLRCGHHHHLHHIFQYSAIWLPSVGLFPSFTVWPFCLWSAFSVVHYLILELSSLNNLLLIRANSSLTSFFCSCRLSAHAAY